MFVFLFAFFVFLLVFLAVAMDTVLCLCLHARVICAWSCVRPRMHVCGVCGVGLWLRMWDRQQ